MTSLEEVPNQISCKVTKSTYLKIKKLIEEGLYLNFSDFARSAIENELDRLGDVTIISVGTTSMKEAMKLIEEYVDNHQGSVYPSDIADHYGLELEIVFEAVKKMKSKGIIKEVE
jgi:GTP-sensing pleiotropic transcriptional regulator CodY